MPELMCPNIFYKDQSYKQGTKQTLEGTNIILYNIDVSLISQTINHGPKSFESYGVKMWNALHK